MTCCYESSGSLNQNHFRQLDFYTPFSTNVRQLVRQGFKTGCCRGDNPNQDGSLWQLRDPSSGAAKARRASSGHRQQRQQRIRAICLMPLLLLEKRVKYRKQGGINSPCPVVLKRARRRDNSPNPLWDLGSTLTRTTPSPRQSRRSTSTARSEVQPCVLAEITGTQDSSTGHARFKLCHHCVLSE